MTSSRYAALSAATRQWVMSQYTRLICDIPDKNQRMSAFFDSVHEGARNGELCALEYQKAAIMPSVSTLDDEMNAKLAKLTEETEVGSVPPLDQTQGSQSGGADPTICGASDLTLPQQRTLFTLDVLDAKIQDVKAKLVRLRQEKHRLLQQERDSRTVRKMMEAEEATLREHLKQLEQARAQADAVPDFGTDDLGQLGLDPAIFAEDLNLMGAGR